MKLPKSLFFSYFHFFSICLSIYLSLYLSIYLSTYLSINLSINLSTYLSIYTTIYYKRKFPNWGCVFSPSAGASGPLRRASEAASDHLGPVRCGPASHPGSYCGIRRGSHRPWWCKCWKSIGSDAIECESPSSVLVSIFFFFSYYFIWFFFLLLFLLLLSEWVREKRKYGEKEGS